MHIFKKRLLYKIKKLKPPVWYKSFIYQLFRIKMSFIKRFLIFFLILKFVFSIDCSWEFVYNKSDPKFKTKQHLQELNSISNAFVQLCDARVGDKYILRTKMLCFDNIFTSILKDAIASYDYLYTFEKCYGKFVC